jgi:hypothetical protein
VGVSDTDGCHDGTNVGAGGASGFGEAVGGREKFLDGLDAAVAVGVNVYGDGDWNGADGLLNGNHFS